MAEPANPKLSAIDRKILRALQEDGRMTVQAIADRVGLSASPCLRRIRQLETAGIISGYAATVDQNDEDETPGTSSRARCMTTA